MISDRRSIAFPFRIDTTVKYDEFLMIHEIIIDSVSDAAPDDARTVISFFVDIFKITIQEIFENGCTECVLHFHSFFLFTDK